MSLEDAVRKGFVCKANALIDDREMGNALSSGEMEQVQDIFNDLDEGDLKIVMTFLVE